MGFAGGEMAEIGPVHRHGRKNPLRIIFEMGVQRHLPDPVRRMRPSAFSIARTPAVFAESPGGQRRGVMGLGPMPGGEVLEVEFGVQTRLLRRREERGIRRIPVHIGKRVLAEFGQISDRCPPGNAAPDQEEKQNRQSETKKVVAVADPCPVPPLRRDRLRMAAMI